ncbi:MAG: hypothetical protein ACO2ZP_01275 [Bacteriovoracaceae bacterium]
MKIVDADIDGVLKIASNIRESDRIEVEAMSQYDVKTACIVGYEMSPTCKIIRDDNDEDVIILGLTEIVGESFAIPWLLGTPRMDNLTPAESIGALQAIKDVGQPWYESDRYLVNYIHDENHLSKKLVKWLGFELCEPEPIGKNGEMFRKFHRGVINV